MIAMERIEELKKINSAVFKVVFCVQHGGEAEGPSYISETQLERELEVLVPS